MTDSFGARLRRERERRAIDMAEVAARTKIKASLFEALERNDVSQWPAGLFRRSFIRAYADAIGLDPQATLAEFTQHFPEATEFGQASQVSARTSAPRPTPRLVLPNGAGGAGLDPVDGLDTPPEPVSLGTTELAAALRLTLAEADMPFQAGQVLGGIQARSIAAACDVGVMLIVALFLFLISGYFWMPLGITAMAYYVGGILLLGNTPGVFLLAPRERAAAAESTEPARAPRPRHADQGRGRTPEPARTPFRAAPRRARTTRT